MGGVLAFLYVDLELGRDGRFHAMAARRGDEVQLWDDVRFDVAHDELVRWLAPGDVLVGHNLHRFDLPAIAKKRPDSPLLRLPSIDTLELSVLAFPARPYHALVKDDRLVRDARPNPVSDVRASEKVLTEAISALRRLPSAERDVLRALLTRIDLAETARKGWRALFSRIGWAWEEGLPLDLREAWRGRVCENAPLLSDPPLDMGFALLSAWMRVVERSDGSVLPGWVRRTWPGTTRRIRALRATACGEPDCAWCATNLSPEHWLQRVFGFEGFRAEPSAPDGGSLQRLLVDRGLRGAPTFGILPTGGGKSLCFQVPAEARYRLLGQLTVVISPLQSLMKDQVDALHDRIPHARAIYSGLAAVLRPRIVEEVRTGACGLLYLSPEQFRNPSTLELLAQRDLGAIVFDEAHCLSQWGHDFRTDYPYVLRAIGELCAGQEQPIPPVYLFTATSQHDATHEILAHVEERTGTRPELFDGGSARDNLTYEVRQVPASQRNDVIVDLLGEHLGDGTAIVFCGSRMRTEQAAADLTALGYEAVAYHAGLDADTRRSVQDAFLAGQHRVIAATNAFGMGVDKPDVRLVVHLDMPSSLEAYLQEAGRAGRDRKPATAVLLWSPGDAEARFSLGSIGDLSVEDLQALWRGIRQLPAHRQGSRERRVATPRELLFLEALVGHFDPHDKGEETRVKAAVNWLEKANVLARRENVTRVFTGSPRLPNLGAALARVAELDLPGFRAVQWRVVLQALYDAGEEGLSADEVAVIARELDRDNPLEGGLRVLHILQQMVDAGLLTAGQSFTAFVSHGVADSSRRRLDKWGDAEKRLVEAWTETSDDGRIVHLRAVADRLTTREHAVTERDVARLIGTWTTVGRGYAQQSTPVRFRHRRDDTGWLDVDVPHDELARWLSTRRRIAEVALADLVERTDGHGKQLLVASRVEDVVARVTQDMTLRAAVPNVVEAVRDALGWLHDLRVNTVQNGLAVFRSAMCLDRDDEHGELRGADALVALRKHQDQRVLRVHVMDGWIKRMLEDPDEAERFRADWFALPVDQFKDRWYPRQKKEIARPTTPESYDAMVTSLGDPDQQAVVTRDPRRNHLVLAGPGSGKTRVLVHRVAWLLRRHRVRASQILVVCYTRANAVDLRRRLGELVGRDARGVRIRTLHSVALSIVGSHELDRDIDLSKCLVDATRMLRGDALDASEQVRQRDALLRGINYLFVDEYQDLDEKKYALLSAIAGRAMQGDQRRLRVFAVGDDDQAIYEYDGASTHFIRRFEDDYNAHRFVLRRNYRNPRAVMELAWDLVAGLPDRLKADERLVVDPARADEPAGGAWAAAHPELGGKVVWHRGGSAQDAAYRLMETVARWLDDGVAPQSVGVLARTRAEGLYRLRIAAEALGVPFSWTLEGSVPVSRVREVDAVLDFLEHAEETVSAADLARMIDALEETGWTRALRSWLAPNQGRRMARVRWRNDLYTWANLERRARTIGAGVHLGTMHGAKGLEFDHVFLHDDGRTEDSPMSRRLLYVALTRARRSLQLFTPEMPSPVFRALRHPHLDVRDAPMLAAEAPTDHRYGFVGRADILIDWLGQQPPGDPGHTAMSRARPGDPFFLEWRGKGIAVVDRGGVEVGRLSAKGRDTWGPRLDRSLRLKLVATVRERADDAFRDEAYRKRLRNETWWTGVWEARWRDR